MTGPLSNLDAPCPICGRKTGDHTMREWSECIGGMSHDLPYEPLAADLDARFREQFGIPEDTVIADNVVVRAATIDGATGNIAVVMPVVFTDFQIAQPGKPPATVAKVAFIGNDASVRGYGRLVKDSANGAVNAAVRKRGAS